MHDIYDPCLYKWGKQLVVDVKLAHSPSVPFVWLIWAICTPLKECPRSLVEVVPGS